MKDWTSEIIDDLCAAKARGEDFNDAWRDAVRRHRPRSRDLGMPAENLFEASQEAEPLTEFLRRVCADAWHGRRPGLRRIALLAESEVFAVAEHGRQWRAA